MIRILNMKILCKTTILKRASLEFILSSASRDYSSSESDKGSTRFGVAGQFSSF